MKIHLCKYLHYPNYCIFLIKNTNTTTTNGLKSLNRSLWCKFVNILSYLYYLFVVKMPTLPNFSQILFPTTWCCPFFLDELFIKHRNSRLYPTMYWSLSVRNTDFWLSLNAQTFCNYFLINNFHTFFNPTESVLS